MCGFAGLAYRDQTRDCADAAVVAMTERLAHRGPDGTGTLTLGPVGLGHRRLSVIDISGGRQPLSNEDQTVWVVYNGEIYNFVELKMALVKAGHRFATACDTEVLVHAYEEWGDDFVVRLSGMFAFALFDARRKRLLLVRDHLGVKPVFYESNDEGLFFGSEIKAVIAGSGSSPTLDSAVVPEYLMFRYAAWDRSLYQGIKRLPPGHLAVWENGRLAIREFWSPRSVVPSSSGSLDDAVDELEHLLTDSVRAQLMSDVPLGVFCSGGIDSGLITRLTANVVPSKVHSFSVSFEDPSWDESRLARQTADRAGTVHHTVGCTDHQVRDLLPRMLWHHDEPLSHPNSIPLAVLSRFARERVTVVLTGEGPDEYLSGYPRHQVAGFHAQLDRVLPQWAVRMFGMALGWLPTRRARLAGDLLRRPLLEGLVLNSRYVKPELARSLVGDGAMDSIAERVALAGRMAVEGDGISSINRYEMVTYLQCALDRMDRMSMASGLEARVPFLDLRLVEWGLRLPSRFKVSGRKNKIVLKALAERWLSPEVATARKSGFGLPLDSWFRAPTFSSLLEPLTRADHPANPLFARPVLERVLTEHRTGVANHGELLWLLVNVFNWYEVNGSAVGRAGDQGRHPIRATLTMS
ncbi:MAG: asparagine synthase (glutamine-hydrolyzing) [Gemmatimonadales bacterium]